RTHRGGAIRPDAEHEIIDPDQQDQAIHLGHDLRCPEKPEVLRCGVAADPHVADPDAMAQPLEVSLEPSLPGLRVIQINLLGRATADAEDPVGLAPCGQFRPAYPLRVERYP